MNRKIGKYEIIREIGKGGVGIVYQAYDPFRDQFIALKVPKSLAGRGSDRFQRHFYNEVNTAAELHHPNIIRVLDAGFDEGVHYIAMEYIDGGITLRKYCKPDNLLPVELTGQMLLKCAEALDYAHRKGVIHRDIKPGNIMLQNGREVKIADFGLAMLSNPDLVDTQDISAMGSPLYMAPECLQENGLTPAADIYALGVVMYEMLSGRPPFVAETLAALTSKVLHDTPAPVSGLRGNIPGMVDEIIANALAKRAADRYQSMMEFAADLSICFHNLDSPLDSKTAERRSEQLKQLSFFRDFGDAEIWELLRWSQWRQMEAGETIIEEGEIGDTMYLLVEGEMEVLRQGRSVAVIPAGELFGEMAYMSRRRRSATVRARTPCKVLQLNIRQINNASKNCQIEFQQLLIRTLTDRLDKTTAQVAGQQLQ